MQKGIRINESQLLYLASKGRAENTVSGYLHKKSNDTGKWQLRWFSLYQNLLFYYENDQAQRPSGVALLEGCYCERQVTPTDKNKDGSKQVGIYIYVHCLFYVKLKKSESGGFRLFNQKILTYAFLTRKWEKLGKKYSLKFGNLSPI